MAVTSMWAVKGSVAKVLKYVANPEKTWNGNFNEAASFQSLENVLQYDANAMKTEKQLYVTGIHCENDPTQAAKDFQSTKERYGKVGGVVCFHGYQAFREGEVTPEQAHKIGVELANELWGDRFQVLVTTHINTGKIHNHFCLNSVAQTDGKRYDNAHKDYRRMRELSDRLCLKYGLRITDKDRNINECRYVWEQERNGKLKSLYDDLDDVLEYVTSFGQFMQEIQNRGYILEYRGSFLRIRPDEGKKFRRLDRLGEGYSEEEIRQRCYDNYRRRPIPRTVPILPKREKATGLVGLFRYYCYLLEHYPKSVPPSRESYVQIRRARQTAQRYTDEATLLDRYQIKTDRDLAAFTADLSRRFKSVAIERSKLRNKLRRMHDSEAMLPIKQNIYDLSAQLKELRYQMKLCEDIAARSGAVDAVVNEMERYTQMKNEKSHKDILDK